MDARTAFRFGQVVVRALRNSNETGELLIGEEISSIGRMRALVPILEGDEEGRAILRDRALLGSASVDYPALRRLPLGTLGRTYVDHLDRCGLDPDALSVRVTRGATDEQNFVLERVRVTHDVWHAVLGLGALGHEEVLVHAFQWPQLRMPYSALVVFFGTFKHLIGEVRLRALRSMLPHAFEAGRRARPLLPVYWERHWDEPLDALRARLGVAPSSAW